jgi:lactate permease
MILAYQQRLDPLHGVVPASGFWSTLFAALPVLVLFWLLVPRRWLAPKAAAAGALTAFVVAIGVYRMPADMAAMAFVNGVGFGLLPVGWTIFSAMLLYNITVETGYFAIVRRSVAGLSGDARIQAVLIGFAFGAFLEGAAGGGTPVAICGAILVGLGFDPFLAAVLCLIANTSPVAYGGLGTPLITLSGVTGLPTETLSIMAGHQLPILSLVVPLYMVKCMCSWRQTLEIWPALLVSGASFAIFQFTFATIHAYFPDVVLYPMTDIGGGIFSLIVTAIFLSFWQPRRPWHFAEGRGARGEKRGTRDEGRGARDEGHGINDAVLTGTCADAAGLIETDDELNSPSPLAPRPSPLHKEEPLTFRRVCVAWSPYALMSLLLLLTGLVRQQEGRGPVHVGPIRTNYLIPVPTLDMESYRDPKLHVVKVEQAAALPFASAGPLSVLTNLHLSSRLTPLPEKAEFNFAWLTSPGFGVFMASLITMLLVRMNLRQIGLVFRRTCFQMRIPIPTIAFMLGLSYITRYAGMDATLGIAFAGTGVLYPFFAPILGWLGVFLTGTDAGSNALFGSLQQITATAIHQPPISALSHLDLKQAQVLICTSNSTGGVMGKMIDAQSICVATAATHQIGREADIFKAVVWHSILLAATVGVITLLQAYVYPFTQLVPGR